MPDIIDVDDVSRIESLSTLLFRAAVIVFLSEQITALIYAHPNC